MRLNQNAVIYGELAYCLQHCNVHDVSILVVRREQSRKKQIITSIHRNGSGSSLDTTTRNEGQYWTNCSGHTPKGAQFLASTFCI